MFALRVFADVHSISVELLQNKPVATESHRRTQNGDLRVGSFDFSVDFCVFLWLNPRQRYFATSLVNLGWRMFSHRL
jgi:hypothetical protein